MSYTRFTILAGAMALMGCQGQVIAADEGGIDGAVESASDAGVIADSAPGDAGRFACPSSPPEAGSPCVAYAPPDGGDGPLFLAACEYGEDPNVSCDDLYVCQDGGTWAQGSAQVADASCPTPPNDAKCAADFASVPRGQACTQADPALCSYPDGFCGCAELSKAADGGPIMKWECPTPGPDPACPASRPRLGSPCDLKSGAGLGECDYRACGLDAGLYVSCLWGSWFDVLSAANPVCQ